MSVMVVTPPLAASELPWRKSSREVKPGSSKWTWGSIARAGRGGRGVDDFLAGDGFEALGDLGQALPRTRREPRLKSASPGRATRPFRMITGLLDIVEGLLGSHREVGHARDLFWDGRAPLRAARGGARGHPEDSPGMYDIPMTPEKALDYIQGARP